MDVSESKSDSRLFCSYDKKFVIKTMDTEAVAEMHSILRDYHQVAIDSFIYYYFCLVCRRETWQNIAAAISRTLSYYG